MARERQRLGWDRAASDGCAPRQSEQGAGEQSPRGKKKTC
jgi:hypothetical protein